LNIPPDDLGELPPPKEDPSFELKPLPEDMKYAYLDEKNIYHVIISANLSVKKKQSSSRCCAPTGQPLLIRLMT